MLKCFCGNLYPSIEVGCDQCDDSLELAMEQFERELSLECTGA